MTRIKHHIVTLYSWVTNPVPGRRYFIENVRSGDPAIRYPQGGPTVLCGRRFAREGITDASRAAKANGDRLVPVEIQVLAWRPVNSPHWFGSWERKSVFDLHRLNGACETTVAEFWKRYLTDDGYHPADIRELMSTRDFVGRMPHYIDRLRLEDAFVGVEVFLWRTQENGRRVARATVYDTRSIQLVRPITVEPVEVAFPVLSPAQATPKNSARPSFTYATI